MTEKSENASNVESSQLEQSGEQSSPSGPSSQIMVKSEKFDAEVEAKLRALNAKNKSEQKQRHSHGQQDDDTEDDDEDCDGDGSSVDDKKAIVPVKSSNEILAELFGVFNAAPPAELLDDKNLLKLKHKKVKKEKKKKKKTKSDGECSESDAEGKHKHRRKKHKHKHKDTKEKDRDKAKEKQAAAHAPVVSVVSACLKEKEKPETKKRASERNKHAEVLQPKREKRERERDRSHNSFYNGYRDGERASERPSERPSNKAREMSDVSLSDEESYLREKASNGRRRPQNSFYDVKEEPKEELPQLHHGKRNAWDSGTRRPRRSRSRSRSRPRDLGIDKKRLLEVARKNAIHMFKRGNLPGVADMTPEVKDKVLIKMRYGGRTVQDLTDFCKKISSGDALSDLSSDEESDTDKNGNAKAFHHPFQLKEREPIVMHIRNSTPILPRREDQTKAITMQFPVSSGQEHRKTETWVPVGRRDSLTPLPSLPPAKQSTNIFQDIQKNVFAKSIPQLEKQEPAFKSIGATALEASTSTSTPSPVTGPAPVPAPVPPPRPEPVPAPVIASTPAPIPFVPEVPIPSATTPVTPSRSAATQHHSSHSASIFPESGPLSMDVSSIITQRLSAIRRLQTNPTDCEAIKMMHNAQRDMSSWASSKHLPGQFTGSTGAHVMKAHELNSGPQLWVRRDQLTSTKPVTGGMGMALLQKMGWKPGEGLGRCKTGSLQPLLLDVKLDKRGLVSREDIKLQPPRPAAGQRKNKDRGCGGVGGGPSGQGVAPMVVTVDKHPVCVLNELTSKNRWTPPQYILQQESGPSHIRSFLFSVEINGQSYTPDRPCNNKKEAKLNAAKLCLESLGILQPS
ncbi:protein SON [Drosophila pseudoobscura]|uniref:Protein SON n=1 Tax=Drosophila pseudoobscura pseudoobscura TaxID=46245 RepID=A0A6I8UR27_DROPS|nr:protein SON [Drosophila pseudoobscura]